MTDEIMNNATELNEEELEEVSGGKISFKKRRAKASMGAQLEAAQREGE